MDNSWIHNDSQSGQPRVMKTKTILCIAIILLGSAMTAIFHNVGNNATQYQAEGIVIDFGDYETVWYEADFHTESDPVHLLSEACTANGFELILSAENKPTAIRDKSNTASASWDFWTIGKNSKVFEKSSTATNLFDCKVVCWAYCEDGSEPTIALDASGTSIYGYSQASRIVTLSPVATETVCSLGATECVVGTDAYSNYPAPIDLGHTTQKIAVVGTYTDPSYESIMHTTPDMVVCDGSQYNHIQMSKTVRNSDVNAILIYEGESIQTIIDNIFITGVAIGYNLAAKSVIDDLNIATDLLESMVSGHPSPKTMLALSTDPAPYVAGDATYASDIIMKAGGINTYLELTGWAHINSEFVGPSGDPKWDSDLILVVTSGPTYHATQEEYDELISGLPNNWKSTKAYANGEIYLLCESLGEMAQRSSPRYAQFMEICARILAPDAFTEPALPKFIGDDYKDHLTITKYLGFEE